MFRFIVLAALIAVSLTGCSERAALVGGNTEPPPGICSNGSLGKFDEASLSVVYVLGSSNSLVNIRVTGIAKAAGDSLYLTTPIENNAIEVRSVTTTGNQPGTQPLEFYMRVDESVVTVYGDGQIVRRQIETPGTIDVLTKDVLE